MFVTISNSNIIKMYILLYMIADCSGVDGPAVALQVTGETQVSHWNCRLLLISWPKIRVSGPSGSQQLCPCDHFEL